LTNRSKTPVPTAKKERSNSEELKSSNVKEEQDRTMCTPYRRINGRNDTVEPEIQRKINEVSRIDNELAELDKLREEIEKESDDIADLQEKYKGYKRRMRIDDRLTILVMIIVFVISFLPHVPLVSFVYVVMGGVVAVLLIRAHKRLHQNTIEAVIRGLETRSAVLSQRVKKVTSA